MIASVSNSVIKEKYFKKSRSLLIPASRFVAKNRIGNPAPKLSKRIERLNRAFPLLKQFKLDPILYQSQNLYFEISREDEVETLSHKPEWVKQFKLLGENLGVKV